MVYTKTLNKHNYNHKIVIKNQNFITNTMPKLYFYLISYILKNSIALFWGQMSKINYICPCA